MASTQLNADASAQWKPTKNEVPPLAQRVLESSNIVSDLLELINQNFNNTEQFPVDRLRIVLGSGGAPTANLDTLTLSLPYEYLNNAISGHAELEETQEAALKRGIDTVEYTLYHLLAHVISKDLSPDNDDTAEAISSWLMIKAWPNGGEQWFENAQAFGRASQLLDGPLEDYWHAHSLYKSRNKIINCWILGSNPGKHEALLGSILDPVKRRNDCTHAWQKLNRSMQELLMPLLKPESELLR